MLSPVYRILLFRSQAFYAVSKRISSVLLFVKTSHAIMWEVPEVHPMVVPIQMCRNRCNIAKPIV